MKNLTISKTMKLHQTLWNWLADNPNQRKKAWPNWKQYPNIEKLCFLCEYRKQTSADCCLVKWESSYCFVSSTCKCYHCGALYNSYCQSRCPEEKTKYAKLIANLKPIKEKEEKINQPKKEK